MQSPPFPRYLVLPDILLNTIFSNTLSFLSSLNVSDQVLHPYKTTGKIIGLTLNYGFNIKQLYMVLIFFFYVCVDLKTNNDVILIRN